VTTIALTRNAIQEGSIAKLMAAHDASIVMLSEDELAASRRKAMERHQGGDLWLFGYGSLIWNPAFNFTERSIGAISGMHRRFCLWTWLGRGSRDCPGLMLALESGGRCTGVAYRIAADQIETELDIVWRREMLTAAYRPIWVRVNTDAGTLPALTFAINRRHERYAGKLEIDHVAERLATACGPLGTGAEYLFNTHRHLLELGVRDRYLDRLTQLVRARQTQSS
jgi:cation transport protein ChaC